MNTDNILSVSELNALARTILEGNITNCWIRGEISGLRTYKHCYFDLVDQNAKISCVIFYNQLNKLAIDLKNSVKVEVFGKVTLYAQGGTYQINVEAVREIGHGDFWLAYKELCNKLKAEGLFNTEHKKVIPRFPNKVGVITSKEGSVIHDVITTLNKSAPMIEIIVYNAPVQGVTASIKLAEAINFANSINIVDVIIVCRGGGSQEDLWCFNDETLARSVYNSYIPIVSGVGHETDTTIIDFVADVRAATPTAAAELVASGIQEFAISLSQRADYLNHLIRRHINDYTQAVDAYARQLSLINPVSYLYRQKDAIQFLQIQLYKAIAFVISQKLDILSKILSTLKASYNIFYLGKQNQLSVLISTFNGTNPYTILERGYTIVSTNAGTILNSVRQLQKQDYVQLTFKDGIVKVQVC